jgi:predicted DNA-binding transcriptional regulator YafY
VTPDSKQMIFWYKNHRGEERYRRVQPIRIYYGRTDYYPEPQWLLAADDLEKDGEYRVFALAQIRDVVGPRGLEISEVTSGRDANDKQRNG